MNIRGKKIIVASQVFIILAFFSGMMLNYYALSPIIDNGEDLRIMTEVDKYRRSLSPHFGCDPRDKSQRDSVLALGLDPFRGEMLIMDSTGVIIYSSEGLEGNGFDRIASRYGSEAYCLVRKEFEDPSEQSSVYYDKKTASSLYARYESDNNLIYFYKSDYRISGSKLLRRFQFLLLFMLIGGLSITVICFLIIKRISEQSRSESLVQQELDTAANLQKSMLPKGERHLMQLDVDARLIPARKVGGDFYYYLLRNGILYFCIGDVSGKGIPASIFMSKAVTLFRSHANSLKTPLDIARSMNEELCINNDSNMFLTAIIGTINVCNGVMNYVNAGHMPPVIWSGKPGDSLEMLRTDANIPLGLMSDMEYKENSYEMGNNGLILLYTDGVSEARDSGGHLLWNVSPLERLEPFKNLSSKEINDSLLMMVSDFERGTEQSDDITLLTFRNTTKPLSLRIHSEVAELRKISPFMGEILKECPLEKKDRILVRSGLDEALTNCVMYAYDSPEGEIEVMASIENRCLHFTIKDNGKPFNPLEYQSSPGEELQVGGLGIKMYLSIFDDVRYSRDGDCNVLELIKKL